MSYDRKVGNVQVLKALRDVRYRRAVQRLMAVKDSEVQETFEAIKALPTESLRGLEIEYQPRGGRQFHFRVGRYLVGSWWCNTNTLQIGGKTSKAADIGEALKAVRKALEL